MAKRGFGALDLEDLSRNDDDKPETAGDDVCGAKTKEGGICREPPMLNGRCRLHGGLTPAKHPNFRGSQNAVKRDPNFRAKRKIVTKEKQNLSELKKLLKAYGYF